MNIKNNQSNAEAENQPKKLYLYANQPVLHLGDFWLFGKKFTVPSIILMRKVQTAEIDFTAANDPYPTITVYNKKDRPPYIQRKKFWSRYLSQSTEFYPAMKIDPYNPSNETIRRMEFKKDGDETPGLISLAIIDPRLSKARLKGWFRNPVYRLPYEEKNYNPSHFYNPYNPYDFPLLGKSDIYQKAQRIFAPHVFSEFEVSTKPQPTIKAREGLAGKFVEQAELGFYKLTQFDRFYTFGVSRRYHHSENLGPRLIKSFNETCQKAKIKWYIFRRNLDREE